MVSLMKRLNRSSSRRRRRERKYLKKKTGVAVTRLVEAVSISDKLTSLANNLRAASELDLSLKEINEKIEETSSYLSQKQFLAVNSAEVFDAVLHLKKNCKWTGEALIKRSDDDADEETKQKVENLKDIARRELIKFKEY